MMLLSATFRKNKVSLWLDCFTLGAPLSFLDHRLKHGNSLIGTTVQSVQTALAAKQKGHFGDLFARPFRGLLSATATIGELLARPMLLLYEDPLRDGQRD